MTILLSDIAIVTLNIPRGLCPGQLEKDAREKNVQRTSENDKVGGGWKTRGAPSN